MSRPPILRRAILWWSCLLWMALLPTASAYYSFGNVSFDPGANVSMEILTPFEGPPRSGAFPVQVRAENRSNREAVWNLELEGRTHYSRHRTNQIRGVQIRLAPGESVRRDYLVPLPGYLHDERFLPAITVHIQGTGVDRITQVHHGGARFGSGQRESTESGYFLLSRELRQDNWGVIETWFDRRDQSFIGSRFAVDELPEESAAYYGVETIWMTEDEADQLTPEVRRALMDWLARGGRLFVVGEDAGQTLARRFPRSRPWPDHESPGARFFGLGELHAIKPLATEQSVATRLGVGHAMTRYARGRSGRGAPVEQNAGQIPIDQFADAVRPSLLSMAESLSQQLPPDDFLLAGVEEPRLRAGPVMAFVLLFGLLVGPANFFLFARRNARHRLFITTPLLSLGAAGAILTVILFQDGIGLRDANRVGFLVWDRQGHEHALLQFQAGVTGLLMSDRFESPGISFATVMSDGAHRRDFELVETGEDRYSGDWFRSRSAQSQWVAATITARGGMEWAAGSDTPAVVSAFPFPIDTVLVRDEEGRWWKADDLHAGVRRPMMEVSEGETYGLLRGYGPSIQTAAHQIGRRTGVFLALTRDPGAAVFLADFGPAAARQNDALIIAGEVDP